MKKKFKDPLLKRKGVNSHAMMRANFREFAAHKGLPVKSFSMTFGRSYGSQTQIEGGQP